MFIRNPIIQIVRVHNFFLKPQYHILKANSVLTNVVSLGVAKSSYYNEKHKLCSIMNYVKYEVHAIDGPGHCGHFEASFSVAMLFLGAHSYHIWTEAGVVSSPQKA